MASLQICDLGLLLADHVEQAVLGRISMCVYQKLAQ